MPHRSRSPRFAVTTWDLSDNCAGRAFILAEMLGRLGPTTLIGPTRRRRGFDLWPPIAASGLRVVQLPGWHFRELSAAIASLATRDRYDFVVASKARFSSLYVALCLAVASRCPLLLDVDEDEMAFGGHDDPAVPPLESLGCAVRQAPDTPLDTRLFTAITQHFTHRVSHKTISSGVLGGPEPHTIIRHARDERRWRLAAVERPHERLVRGYAEDDFVIMFMGTPRAHKGLRFLDDSLRSLDDDRIVLQVFGASNSDKTLSSLRYKRVRVGGYVDWDKIPNTVCCADLVCIVQDRRHPVTQTQTPAKITDAIALNVPVFANFTPPLAELEELGALTLVDEPLFAKAISTCVEGANRFSKTESVFMEHFSYHANVLRLCDALESASQARGDLEGCLEDLEHVVAG